MRKEYWICAAIGSDGKRYAIRATFEKYLTPQEAVREAYGGVSEGYLAKRIGTRKTSSQTRFHQLCVSDDGWIHFKRKKKG